ncbi:hypothetical protein Mar181_1127 [Marinomonas posidonica IVIA-Po-181]|uniref:Uncharacterized protein n=1 Tax=Marinomonas posidonica (strain CECT 7376 / NCIMB 14433 / IVIA-Po-181) TaxID=491952 RepID=F6CUR5_MARPP|nr:hypothetical protein Mar181_1127 [Marinomonas posidonica IVIA-Po-181]
MIVEMRGLYAFSALFIMLIFAGEVNMKTTLGGILLVGLLMTLSACVFIPPGGPGPNGVPGRVGGSPTLHR